MSHRWKLLNTLILVVVALGGIWSYLTFYQQTGSHIVTTSVVTTVSGTEATVKTPRPTIQQSVHVVNETSHYGDFIITRGQTYIIANRIFNMISGNIIVDGGTLIVANATLVSNPHPIPVANWILQNGGCMEFTNVNNYVLDDLWVGGRVWKTSLDNSTLFVNRCTMAISVFLTGSNVTVYVNDSIWEGFIKFTNWGPQKLSKVTISNSLIRNIGLAFGGGVALTPRQTWPPQGELVGLTPGYFSYWNLRGNQTKFSVPYDLTLRNVTLIPNTIGPNITTGFGWTLMLSGWPGGPTGIWPNLTVCNSRLTGLELSWPAPLQPVTISDIPSRFPVDVTLFDSFKLVNSIVDCLLVAGSVIDSNVTFLNSESLGIWAHRKSNVTLINSRTIDFNPWNCEGVFLFVNSSWGFQAPPNLTQVPYYEYLQNASNFWSSATGYGAILNSSILMMGNLTFHWNYQCWSNSTVTRVYPIIITDTEGRGLFNVTVSLSTPDGRVLKQKRTNMNGRVDMPIFFDDGNWTKYLVLTALGHRQNVNFTTNTPIIMQAPSSSVRSWPVAGLPQYAIKGPVLSNNTKFTISQPTAGLFTLQLTVCTLCVIGGRRKTPGFCST